MDTGNFYGRMKVNTNIDAPTVIYYSVDYYYSSDIKFEVSHGAIELKASQYTMKKGDNRIEFQVTDTNFDGEVLDFHLTPL